MQETSSEVEGAHEAQAEEKKDTSRAKNSPRTHSREPLWGTILLACMLLFVIASIGGIGWVVYSKWQSERAAESRPSISALPERSDEQAAASPQTGAEQAADTKEQPASGSLETAKKLEISVLNGGGAKGSAGVLADFLKSEGYLKTDAGNTLKDYSGVTVYHAAALEKEAEAIKASVIKKYPQAKILPADATNKETSVSQVTIILGK